MGKLITNYLAMVIAEIGPAMILLVCLCTGDALAEAKKRQDMDSPLILALYHFAPSLGDVDANQLMVKKAMTMAKQHGAEWLLTPELALTGYYFTDKIGTDWVPAGLAPSVQSIKSHAEKTEIGVLLSHLERPAEKPTSIFNTLFVIDAQGEIRARHRKINTIPRSEDWASKGSEATMVTLSGYNTGLLICADAWPAEHARQLKQMDAQLIISPANWGPGRYGPGDTWEKRSKETGIPWVVNNRTGVDKSLDLRQAKSVVAEDGNRVFEYSSETDALILLHWQRTLPTPTLAHAQVVALVND